MPAAARSTKRRFRSAARGFLIGGLAVFFSLGLTLEDASAAISGQLWYTILDVPGPNGGAPPGTPARRVGGFFNSDGTSITQAGAFFTATPSIPITAGQVPTAWNVAVDTAAGMMFVVDSDGLSVSVYNTNTNALIQILQVGDPNGSGTLDDDVVAGLAVDPINHVLFVGRWDSTLAASGIVKITYDPTAASNPLNANGAFNGGQQFLITNAGTSGKITNPSTIEVSIPTHKLYYVDWDNNYNLAPFTPQNAIYSVSDYTAASPTVTRLTTAAQFPANASGGWLGNLAVDDAKGLIYFTASDYTDPGQAHLYYMPIAGGTATKIIDIDNVNLGGSIASGLTLDPAAQQLYVSLAAYDPPAAGAYPNAPTANANKVLVYQLSADGHSFVGGAPIASYTLDELEGQASANTGGAIGSHPGGSVWNALPTLTVTGTATHAVEQGAFLKLAASNTSADADGGYYRSATVQIAGGTFATSETSASDDHLSVLDGATNRTSGVVTGTNITVAYDSAAEKLSLTGYDTIANYNTVLSNVRFNSTGDNPTNYGANTTRTIQWVVSDGALNVPFGVQNSGSTTLTIDAANDAPVNQIPSAQIVNEDTNLAITGLSISDVDANPATASMTTTLAVSNGTLTVTSAGGATVTGSGTTTVTLTGTTNQINTTLSAAGNIVYKGLPNYFGADTLVVTTNDNGNTGSGGALQDVDNLGITVNPVNDPPTLNAISDPVAILEDAGQQTVNLVGITSGPTNENTQTLTVTAASNNTGLIPNPTVSYTSANTTGSLSYTPVANANGSATITVTVMDNGGTANGGVNTFQRTFVVNVTAVNDAPTLNAISDPVAILEDAGQQTVNLSGITSGPANESAQTLQVTASSNNTGLIPNPTVTYTSPGATGSLTYTPVANANGSATITVTVSDNGGTANGGANSFQRTFVVNVTAVNDPPTMNTIADPAAIQENSGLQTVNLGGIAAGPANESQLVTISPFSNNTSLIPTPSVNYNSPSTTGSVTYTPTANLFGSAMVTLTVQDNGGTANGGVDSIQRSFSVVVNPTLDQAKSGAKIQAQGGGVFALNFTGNPNTQYTVQYSPDLTPNSWVTLGLRTADANGAFSINDTPPSGTTKRFYRAIIP